MSTDLNSLWLLAEWHEVKPQRTLYQYVTGLWACAQIVGQSHARRHDGMGCNSVPPAQLAYPRDMSYHTAPAHSCLVCKGLIPEWPKSSLINIIRNFCRTGSANSYRGDLSRQRRAELGRRQQSGSFSYASSHRRPGDLTPMARMSCA